MSNTTTTPDSRTVGHGRRGEHPDIHFSNGRILTMSGPLPEYVESLVISQGRIVFVGATDEATTLFPEAQPRDLAGSTLLPGFIDAHSHFQMAFSAAQQVNVGPPPLGGCTDIPAVIRTLAQHVEHNSIPSGGWVIGYGYDQEALAEKRHITAADLDAHFPNHLVVITHVSSHGVVLNSAALAHAGIDANTPTPAGGVISRIPGTQQPSGLLMETAYLELLLPKLPSQQRADKLALFDTVQQSYAAHGYTHANDGFSTVDDLMLYQEAAGAGLLYLDLAAVGSFAEAGEWLGNPDFPAGKYHQGFKLAGVKILLDGSPQGRTAFMSKPYLTGGLDGQAEWCGEATVPFDVLASVIRRAFALGVQAQVHVNGDAAIDQLIQAVDGAGMTAGHDARTVAIHSQFQRPDHLPEYLRLGITPSYFTNHTFFWGDVHRDNVGEDAASFISPLKSAMAAGLVVSNHSDFPVTSLDPRFMVFTAMNRTTRSGHILGPDERVNAYDALQALTSGPAYQLFEESRKGKLEVGLLADLVMLDVDPLTLGAAEILTFRVLETIKEGITVYRSSTTRQPAL